MKIYLPLAVACLSVLAGCAGKQNAGGAAGGEAAPATPVQVGTARRDAIQRLVNAEAVLYPVKQATIVPKISAPVRRFLVNRGDRVREGQLLAVLEDKDLVAAADESKGLYQQAEAAYETTTGATMPDDFTKATTDVEAARQAYESAKKVYESRQNLLQTGALPRKLVDDARLAMVQAQTQFETTQQHLKSLETVGRSEQVKSAKAQVQAAKSHYDGALAQVSYAEVRSPLSGYISDRPLNIGEMASAGSALFSIVDISRVVARASISLHEAAALKTGSKATLTGPDGSSTGKVTVVSPAVDPSTTTVEVWIEAPNPDGQLKAGSTVHIAIDAGTVPDAVVVPVEAILSSDEGGEKVMVAGSDSVAHERKVEIGVRSGDQVQILSGVNPGEQVITQGGLGLDDKAKIQITKPENKEEAQANLEDKGQ
jgi:HlyD family secretion protein